MQTEIGAIAATPWADWTLEQIGSDASSRSYARLIGPRSESVILVEVDPNLEDYDVFVSIAEHLEGAGFCVPQRLWSSPCKGYHIVTDLGRTTVAQAIKSDPDQSTVIHEEVLSVLLRLRDVRLDGLSKMTPNTAISMLKPLYDIVDYGVSEEIARTLRACFNDIPDLHFELSLRDFHGENMIWRADRVGSSRIGLLDFQDAFMAPTGYDLASFTRDVRRVIPPATQSDLESRFALAAGLEPRSIRKQVALLAVQRNLRILGVFAKLEIDGKVRYRDFVPTVWRYLSQDLQHPEFSDLRTAVDVLANALHHNQRPDR